MKKLFIKLFGKDTYCKWFHTGYGIDGRPGWYRCPKCGYERFSLVDKGAR